MTNQHPITPPPELVQQLRISSGTWLDQITVAYRAGSDQELEATLGLMATLNIRGFDYIRNVRRPKPPSLKEQALEQLRALDQHGALDCNTDKIRRALKALPDAL